MKDRQNLSLLNAALALSIISSPAAALSIPYECTALAAKHGFIDPLDEARARAAYKRIRGLAYTHWLDREIQSCWAVVKAMRAAARR